MPDSCLELSFEVANKVGGIYQVLKSKSCTMQGYYGDEYLTVGYYDEENARDDFAPREVPERFREVFSRLEEEGIELKYGAWRIEGSPRCILVDSEASEIDLGGYKSRLWEERGVDSLEAGDDFDTPVRWSYAAGRLVDELEHVMQGETVVHLHEWLSGPALFEADSPTVFTTHATVLGRTLSNSDYRLQEAVERGEVDADPADYGVKPKHQVEREAAEAADVFTTVSDVTASEAEAVLGVEVDKVLPNGFNVSEFPSLEDLSYQHKEKKERMKEFLSAYFEPYYDVDLEDDPRILYTSGRYEFHNKGLDVLTEALARLNGRPGDDVFVFIFVPTETVGPRPEVLENVSLYQELEDYIESLMPEMRSELLSSLTSGEDPSEALGELVEQTSREVEVLQRNFHSRDDRAPLCAFDLGYPDDEIMERLWNSGLRNREGDRVKVVFYPSYLSRGDRLLSMDYQEAVKASSAGIFPSYYEPWGYTPVETAANGAMAVTTDMAGFGRFLERETTEKERKGILVLDRKDVPDEEAAGQLADMLEDVVSYDKTEITERKHNARRLAQLTSWKKLGKNYREAHRMAAGEET